MTRPSRSWVTAGLPPDAYDGLTRGLPASRLWSLLLGVAEVRAIGRLPSELVEQWDRDRFVQRRSSINGASLKSTGICWQQRPLLNRSSCLPSPLWASARSWVTRAIIKYYRRCAGRCERLAGEVYRMPVI